MYVLVRIFYLFEITYCLMPLSLGCPALLRKMMHTDPDRRLTIEQVQRDRWFTRWAQPPPLAHQPNSLIVLPVARFLRSNKLLTAGKCNDPVSLAERLLQGLIVSGDMSLHSDGARANVPEK